MEQVPVILAERSVEMRRAPTLAERKLWRYLRNNALGVKFRRQVVRGNYIADFACLSHDLIVEVDGAHHIGSAYDQRRDAWLKEQGYRVLRFPNRDVFRHIEDVLAAILAVLQEGRC